MAKLTNIEQLRRKRARQRLTRNLVVMTILGAIVLGAAVVVNQLGRTELKTAVSDIRAEITSGSGFPVPLPGGRYVRMAAVGGTLVYQTDTNLYSFNETGRQMLTLQHGMENPVLSVGRDRILAYDRGGTRINIYSRSALINTMECKFPIYDVDLGEKGSFAVASGSDSFLAMVAVYDASLKNIFNWYSAERPVISVSIADNKDSMVVGCVDVKGGAYRSDIQRFQFNMDKEMARTELEQGELLLSLDYHGSAGIRAATDSRVVLYGSDLKEQKEYRLENQRLLRFSFLSDGRTLLLLQGLTGSKENTLVVLGQDLKEEATLAVPQGLLSIDCDGEYLYLTDRDKISIYRMDGTEALVVIAGGLHGSQLIGDKLYYATATGLELLPVRETIAAKGHKDTKPAGSSAAASQSSASKPPEQDEDSSQASSSASESADEEAAQNTSSDAESLPEVELQKDGDAKDAP